MSYKICIITPGSIATNPRVVKEATALSQAGYRVHLIYTRHINYLVKVDQEILDKHPEWTTDFLDWSNSSLNSKAIKYISGLKKILARTLLKSRFIPAYLAAICLNRFYFWQLKKAVECKADFYISHYPACLSIAFKAAELNRTFFSYDAEDYHRGEDLPQFELTAIQQVENSFLPFAKYISTASPMIGQVYQKLYPKVQVVNIANMFELKNQTSFKKIPFDIIKFFWFSQTIGIKRGLEEFISILALTKYDKVLLSLAGNISDTFRNTLITLWSEGGLPSNQLIFIKNVPEEELFEIASCHHFGLCLEIPYVPNKEICLSNKLFTYILSGNSLIFSNTKAQVDFHKTYPKTGICLELNRSHQSAEKLLELFLNPSDINSSRLYNHELGRSTLNYDIEKQTLINLLHSFL